MSELIIIQNLLRAFLASSIAFFLSLLATPFWTNFAYKYKLWKQVKTETLYGKQAKIFQKLHAAKHKRHIPTMAGVLIWGIVAIVTFAFNLTRSQTYLPLFAMLSVGLLGLVDDWMNIRGIGGIKGIRARHKMLWLTVFGALGAWWFFFKLGKDIIHIPAVGSFHLGWLYIPLFILIILFSANAVNITDGLDGLSAGLLSAAFGSYGLLALVGNQISLAIFCATIVGALLSYLWFNIYPARFFGGDTYALSMGATLGVVACLIPNGVGITVLPLIAFVPLMETISVILQMAYRKLCNKKLFLIAPLHHHFEALGWPETKVTMRFWVVGIVFALLGVIIALLGRG